MRFAVLLVLVRNMATDQEQFEHLLANLLNVDKEIRKPAEVRIILKCQY